MSPRSGVAAAAVLIVGLGAARSAQAQCVDEALREQLVGKRAYRGVVPRLFKKALRHEVSLMGGWYAGDLGDGAPVYGAAYTFHFSEDLGLEAGYFRTQQSYRLLNAVIERQQGLVDLVEQESQTVQQFLGHLVWSFAYGKVRYFGGPIGRYDFYLSLGAGATDQPGALGLTGSAGFGMKFHVLQWMSLRLDVRDHIRSQQAPLGVEKIVNDISATGGLSVFIPFWS